MIKKIKKAIIRILKSFVNRLGYEMHKKEKVYPALQKDLLLQNFYELLIRFNFKPKYIIDVGANHGSWTRLAIKYFPNAGYFLFEPQYWMKTSVQDLLANKKIKFFPLGLGKDSGNFNFTIVDRDDSCSFRFTPEEAKEKGFRQIELPISKLDDLIAKNTVRIPDIIKIDAEGLDLEVLQGASKLFGKTEIFMIEAGVMNKQVPNNMLKIISFMDEKGYRFFEITDVNRPFPSGVLWLLELVFIKKNGFLDKQSFKT